MKFNKFILIYDYNKIQLDIKVFDVSNVDLLVYFKVIGFNVIEVNEVIYLNVDKVIIEVKKLDKFIYIMVYNIIVFFILFENIIKGYYGILISE